MNKTSDVAQTVKYSDDALSDLFSTRHAKDFRYVERGWWKRTGTQWKQVSDVVVMDAARQICQEESEVCLKDADLTSGMRFSLSRSIASARAVRAVISLARGDSRHYRNASQFEADPTS